MADITTRAELLEKLRLLNGKKTKSYDDGTVEFLDDDDKSVGSIAPDGTLSVGLDPEGRELAESGSTIRFSPDGTISVKDDATGKEHIYDKDGSIIEFDRESGGLGIKGPDATPAPEGDISLVVQSDDLGLSTITRKTSGEIEEKSASSTPPFTREDLVAKLDKLQGAYAHQGEAGEIIVPDTEKGGQAATVKNGTIALYEQPGTTIEYNNSGAMTVKKDGEEYIYFKDGSIGAKNPDGSMRELQAAPATPPVDKPVDVTLAVEDKNGVRVRHPITRSPDGQVSIGEPDENDAANAKIIAGQQKEQKKQADEIKHLQEENKALKEENATLKGEIGALKGDKNALEEEKRKLEEENKELKKNKEQLEQENAELKTENTGLKAEKERIERELGSRGDGREEGGNGKSSVDKNAAKVIAERSPVSIQAALGNVDVDGRIGKKTMAALKAKLQEPNGLANLEKEIEEYERGVAKPEMGKEYKVKQGDTAWSLANRLGVKAGSEDEFCEAIGLKDPKHLAVGQILDIKDQNALKLAGVKFRDAGVAVAGGSGSPHEPGGVVPPSAPSPAPSEERAPT